MSARPLLLLSVLLLVPIVQAQDAPFLVTGGDDLLVHGGATENTGLQITSLASQAYQIRIDATLDPEGNWQATVEPDSFVLGAGDQHLVTVHVTAEGRPTPRNPVLVLSVQGVGEDFDTHDETLEFQVRSTGTDSILGRWDNPFPAPLDGAWGAFLLNFASWWIIGLATMWLVNPTLKVLTVRTKTDLDDRIIRIVSKPVFVLVFTFGIKQSLEVFALPVWMFNLMDRLWRLVLVLAIVYAGYKLWHAVVLAIGRRVARKTESDLDDRLYPLFENVGGILILVVGVFYAIGTFGVDLTLFAAGGAIGGLVIAFAAQDTLANFFAGVFILLDRPFRVGDRIELPEQEHWGDVQRIGLRTTSVRTQDNRMVIFPNSYIGSNPVVNHSFPDPHYRIQVDFKLPYGSDVEFVRTTLVNAVRPVEGVWAERAPEALLLEFTEHGQKWRLRWWINSYVDTRRMFDRVNSAVIKEMAAEGIRIPYQPITLWDAHKLMERESGGGLLPKQLEDHERTALEEEAEAHRKVAEQQEAEDIEEMKRQEAERQRTNERPDRDSEE